MYRALFVAVSVAVLAVPVSADVRGATCTTADPFLPGGTATMCWTCSNGSPSSPSPECLDRVALGYPDGWSVACASQAPATSGGNAVALACEAGGQNVTYSDTDAGAGEVCPGESWSFCVDVTAPTGDTQPRCVFYTLSGDASGAEPHDIIDCATVQAAQGSVTIANDALPADTGQAFEYSGDLGAFSLAADGSITVSPLLPGTYDVTEVLPAGWDLGQITCDDPDGGTTVDLATSTVRIDLDADESVVCTFHNTAQGSVTITNDTVPQDAAQTFEYAGDLGAFSLTGGGSRTFSGLSAGTYDVTELLPGGWGLGQITCEDPDGGTTVDLGTATAGVDLDPGEHVVCTFHNTALGSVTITKETVPEDAGGQLFEFTGDLGGFSLAGGGSTTVSDLQPGSYRLTEVLPAGWDLSEITCEDPDGGTTTDLGTATGTIDLDAGEQVACTFLNTALGSVTVIEETVPQDAGGQLFEFEGDLGAFSLTGGQSTTIGDLQPGSYSLSEVLPAGWDLTRITCDDPDGASTTDLGSATAGIDLDAGEHVVCTFLNTAQGSVTITNRTVPEGADQVFEYGGDLGAFSLTAGAHTTISTLSPGTYDVTETLPAGWDLSDITCNDPDGGTIIDLGAGTVAIDLDAGEQVSCTFFNAAMEASITILKQTRPADSGGQTFDFTGDLGAFSLTGDGSRTVRGLEPGRYDVTETPAADWDLTSIWCGDPDGGTAIDLGAATATIDLDPHEQITCVFSNRLSGYVASPIPTLSRWMLLLLAGLLAAVGVLVIRHRVVG